MEKDLLLKLNEYNNFHLSLKVIQITDNDLISKCEEYLYAQGKTVFVLLTNDSLFENLLKAYESKVDYVLINENINILLPQSILITKDVTSIIKPMIPVYYLLKDNKVIQKIKTHCHKTSTMFYQIKSIDDIQQLIKKSKSNT